MKHRNRARKTQWVSAMAALILLFGWLCPVKSFAVELAVTPMLIEMEHKANARVPFTFTVTANKRTRIKLTPYDMAQQISGHMDFIERSSTTPRNTMAISFKNDRLTIPASQPTAIKGTLILPRKQQGTQLVAIMVEEDNPESSGNGIRVNVRYAVIIRVNVLGGLARERGRVERISMSQHEGRLMMSGVLTNLSSYDYRVSSQLEIRDNNNKLLERVKLKSQAAWKNGQDQSRVFPGAQVRLLGPVKSIVQPGQYKVRMISRLGHKGQIVVGQTINLTAEQLPKIVPLKVDNQPRLAVAPNPLPVTVRPDKSAISFFTVTNSGAESMTVIFPAKSEQARQPSAFQFYPQRIELRPGKQKRVLLKQQFPSAGLPEERTFRAKLMRGTNIQKPLEIRTVITAKAAQAKAG